MDSAFTSLEIFTEIIVRCDFGRFWLSLWTAFYGFLILCTNYVEIIRVSDFHLVVCFDVCMAICGCKYYRDLIDWGCICFGITIFIRIFIERHIPAFLFHLIVYARVCLALFHTDEIYGTISGLFL